VNAPVTTRGEYPVFLRAGGEELFAIVTEPTGEPNQLALIMLAGGNVVGGTGRNRMWVRLARRVAARGYHALRLDYHGIGESTGEIESFEPDRPFVDDLLAGVRCLEGRGVREIAVAGWCFGARTALASADQIPGLRGLALINAPVRDTRTTSYYLRKALTADALRGFLDARSRRRYRRMAGAKLRAAARSRPLAPARRAAAKGVSPLFSDPLDKLAARGVPVLIAFESEAREYGAFREARPRLAGLLEAPGTRVEERLIVEDGLEPGVAHGETRVAVQDAVTTMIEEWLVGLDGNEA
jgi:uncharacterized protein